MDHSRHTRRTFLKTIGLGLTSVVTSRTFGSSGVTDRSKPNFIIIFTDDQGYNDVGCFGSESIRMPRLDQMASEGMKLTSFYTQTVCGPARCALLTGCYPKRAGFDANSIRGWSISTKEITTAEVLKKAGYISACIGKWDLSARRYTEGLVPNDQGFDYYFGTLGANDGGRVIDGRDQSALITGKTSKSARDTFYYYVRSNLHAVRRGKWKLALPSLDRNIQRRTARIISCSTPRARAITWTASTTAPDR